jgi:hypothetical protein
MTTAVPRYRVVQRPDLMSDPTQDVLYQLTGARVEGTIAARVTRCSESTGRDRRLETEASPAVHFDLTPLAADKLGHTPNGREHLWVNGKHYPYLSADVNFLPSGPDDDRVKWYRQVEFDGELYVLSVRFQSTGLGTGLTDGARNVLSVVLESIAVEFLTLERWHERHIREAVRAIDTAKQNVAAKQEALEEAHAAERDAVAHLDTIIQRYAAAIASG